MPCSNTHLAGVKFLGSRNRSHRMIMFCNYLWKGDHFFRVWRIYGRADWTVNRAAVTCCDIRLQQNDIGEVRLIELCTAAEFVNTIQQWRQAYSLLVRWKEVRYRSVCRLGCGCYWTSWWAKTFRRQRHSNCASCAANKSLSKCPL